MWYLSECLSMSKKTIKMVRGIGKRRFGRSALFTNGRDKNGRDKE